MILNSNGSPEQTDARRRLALAISAKGVPTDAKASFIQMAENVAQIPQQYSDGESYFASFVMPEEYIFNVFGICEKMIGENPHPEFPAFFVAEYYRGFDSLVLTGADAYLTCDGDFYQTLDKTAEVTHVWHDADNGKSNRYVVFYYMQDGYTFANSTVELCPRRVALAGRCASFVITGENRLTDVYVLGTLENFNGGTTGTSWNPAQVIRNYMIHSSGVMYYDFVGKSCIIPELKEFIGGELFGGTNAPSNIILPNLVNMGEDVSLLISGQGGMGNVEYISIPKLKVLSCGICRMSAQQGSAFSHLSEVRFESLDEINITKSIFHGFKAIVENTYSNSNFARLKTIYLPKLTKITSGYIIQDAYNIPITPNLIDIEVGEMITNLMLSAWKPTTVLSTPEGIATINANIRNHIAAKVSDRTGDTALTFTVSANLYANLEQATIDAFTAKNWNVAGA